MAPLVVPYARRVRRRALHFPRLFYFLGPVFEMTLLVPEAEAERAAALVEATDFRIV